MKFSTASIAVSAIAVDQVYTKNQIIANMISYGDLTFGESFDAVGQGKTNVWVSIIIDGGYFNMLSSLRRRLPLMNLILPFMLPKDSAAKYAMHNRLTGEKLDKRLEMGDSAHRDDFFSYILRKGGNEVSRAELVNQSSTLIVGGSETTATCLLALAYYLLKDRARLEKLNEEVRAAFGSVGEITGESASRLPYLNAVIEESLRIFSPASFGLPRQRISSRYSGGRCASITPRIASGTESLLSQCL
ncbi:hypothetical protein K4K61_002543 [Colletotrichum sp. SAR11_59]|nr:hypothetical protein K4K61_002543 [Colletotrichum sp. SAR11_59]